MEVYSKNLLLSNIKNILIILHEHVQTMTFDNEQREIYWWSTEIATELQGKSSLAEIERTTRERKVEPHVIMASYLLPAKVHAWFPCNATAPELAQIWPRRRRYQEARSQVIKKLSPEELQARRDKDFCFNCKFLIMRFTVRRRDVELKGKSTNGRNKRRLFFLLFLSWRRRY